MAIKITAAKPNMKASVQPMQAAKHFDIVLGLDFHIVKTPVVPVPIPIVPFGALIFDPMDYISITIPAMPAFSEDGKFHMDPAPMGGSVLIDGFYRGAATSALLALPPFSPPIPGKMGKAMGLAKKFNPLHLVVPKPLFLLPFLAPHDGQISHGSKTVMTQQMEQSTHMDHCWSCNEMGQIVMNSPTALYANYATVILIVLPFGRPVIVGGERIEHKMSWADLVNALMMMGLTKIVGSAAKKLTGKLLTKLNKALSDKFPNYKKFGDKVQPSICTHLGEPVDVASGNMTSLIQGFSLPGPIPFEWEANYDSRSSYQGPLGIGMVHSYDISLKILPEQETVLVNDAYGRGISFSTLLPGEEMFNPLEKYTLYRDKTTKLYHVKDNKGLFLYFHERQNSSGLHALKSIVDRNAFSIRFEYNRNYDVLEKITDSCGRIIHVHSDENERIVALSLQHPTDNTQVAPIRYAYDSQGRMTQFTDVYDASNYLEWQEHYITARTFKDGTTFTFTYQKDGKCIAAEGPNGLFSYFFQYKQNSTLATNSLGHTSEYYHKDGIVLREITPEGGVKTFTYDAFRNKVAEQDAAGIVSTWEYDEKGNLITIGHPGKGQTQVTYNQMDLPETIKQPNGGIWQYAYDGSGNMTHRVNPMGAGLHYRYHDGLLSSISNDLGVTTRISYDKDYNLAEVVLPAGRGRINYCYDGWGNNLQISTPTGNGVRRQYDLRQRVTRVVNADGLVTNIAYNNQDDIIGASDNYSSVQLDRNFFGDVVQRRQGKSEISFQFDKEGQLTDIYNEHHENYHFDYDQDGNVIEETGFDDKKTGYNRDLAGKVIEKNSPSGTTHYSYNSGGQLTDILYPDQQIEHFDFDAMGMLRNANNTHSNVQLTRNLLGQVLEEKTDACTITHQYDEQGRHLLTESSLGASISQQYNDLGDILQRKAMDWQTEMQYDQYGRLTGKKGNNGLEEQYSYDAYSRLVSQTVRQQGSTRAGHRRDYNWQAGNRLKAVSDSTTGTKQFHHDVYGNLTEVLYGDGSVEYREPDLVGNLFETPTKTDRQYDKGSKLLQSDKARYEYDAEGNLTRKTLRNGDIWQYHWQNNGMLDSVLRPDGFMVQFQYDALGRRILKKFKSTTTHYVWDGNKPLHEWKELDAKDTSADDIITWIFEQGNFSPVAKLKGTKNYTILADHLGTPIKGYNQEGSLIWQRELDSYGNAKMLHGEEGFCNYLYQGQTLDTETGLAYNRFRYYDPEQGNYISQDPIGLDGGNPTLYGYVKDITKYLDILGLLESVLFDQSKVIKQVEIQMQGSRDGDFKAANEQAGLKGKKGKTTIDAHKQTYGDVTWHHASYNAENNTAVMQLVTRTDHEATLPHKGSVKEFEDATGTIYESQEAKKKAKELNTPCG